jgi:hypothetical protein
MAIPHAKSGEVIDIRPLGEALARSIYRRRRRIGEYNTVVWRIGHAETSSKVST